jgi:hypothetical protein
MLSKHRFRNIKKSLLRYLIDLNFLRVGKDKHIFVGLLTGQYKSEKYLKKLGMEPLKGIDDFSEAAIEFTNIVNDPSSYQGYITDYWVKQFSNDLNTPTFAMFPSINGAVAFRSTGDRAEYDQILTWNIRNGIAKVRVSESLDEMFGGKLVFGPEVLRVKVNENLSCKLLTVPNPENCDDAMDLIPNILSNCFKRIAEDTVRKGHWRKKFIGGKIYIKPKYVSDEFTDGLVHVIHTNN